MSPSFKSVILFRDSPALFEAQKEFEEIPFVKFFHTSNPDEVSQIVAQSDQSIIFLYNPKNAKVISELRKKNTKIFYYDQLGIARSEVVGELSLLGISTLRPSKVEDIVSRISLLFFGKGLFVKSEPFQAYNPGPPGARASYFSLFEYSGWQWRPIVSTHELDADIEFRFSQSWSLYLKETLDRAQSIKSIEESSEFSRDYHSIIYPHVLSATPKLSLIHLKKNGGGFQEARAKALAFLEKIDT